MCWMQIGQESLISITSYFHHKSQILNIIPAQFRKDFGYFIIDTVKKAGSQILKKEYFSSHISEAAYNKKYNMDLLLDHISIQPIKPLKYQSQPNLMISPKVNLKPNSIRTSTKMKPFERQFTKKPIELQISNYKRNTVQTPGNYKTDKLKKSNDENSILLYRIFYNIQ